MEKYKQCFLTRRNEGTTTWLPITFAKVGKKIDLKENGEWSKGWKIIKVFDIELTEKMVLEKRDEYRDHRKRTDIFMKKGKIKIFGSIGCEKPYGIVTKKDFKELCSFIATLPDSEIDEIEFSNGSVVAKFNWRTEKENSEKFVSDLTYHINERKLTGH